MMVMVAIDEDAFVACRVIVYDVVGNYCSGWRDASERSMNTSGRHHRCGLWSLSTQIVRVKRCRKRSGSSWTSLDPEAAKWPSKYV